MSSSGAILGLGLLWLLSQNHTSEEERFAQRLAEAKARLREHKLAQKPPPPVKVEPALPVKSEFQALPVLYTASSVPKLEPPHTHGKGTRQRRRNTDAV